jgi:aryl-alcohol dehydrogenase-like predicted oxidoreductase
MSYSLLNRGIEHEIVPFSQHTDLGLLTYSPLAGGLLSGKYTRENPTGNVDGRDGRDGRLASFDALSADLRNILQGQGNLFPLGTRPK